MKLHQIPKTSRRRKRVGRGISAGQGKTAGLGTKGQKARSGNSIPTGFEGGQTKLYMRLPKRRGLRDYRRTKPATVTLAQLDKNFKDGDRVNLKTLTAAKIIGQNVKAVRVVNKGKLSKKLKFAGLTFTQSVHEQLFSKKSVK